MHEQLNQILGYAEGMWRWRWWALLVAWLVALVGWLAVYSLPNVYQASTVMNVDTYSIMDPLLKGMTVELKAGDELLAVTRMLLRRENLELVLRDVGIDVDAHTPLEQEQLIRRLRAAITIEDSGISRSDPNTRIYAIHYQDESPERAYRVVAKLSEVLIESSLNSERRDVAAAQRFLDAQIADYEKRLTVAEQRLADFKKKNVGLMPDERGGYYARMQSALSAIENTRTELQLAKRRQAELSKQLSGESPLISSSAYGGPGSPASMLRQYQEERAHLLNRYTEQHPDVQELETRIAELKAAMDVGGSDMPEQVDDESKAELNPVYQDLKFEWSKAGVEVESLKIRLAELERKSDNLNQYLDTMPEIEAQLARLNRDYEVTKSRYLDLVERRESAQLAQEAEQSTSESTFRIIEPPRVPAYPAGPKRGLFLSGVLAAAFGAGLGLALILVLVRPTFTGSRELKDFTELPVLGAVGLHLSPAAERKQSLNLRLFVMSTVLLLGVYFGAVVYRDAGSAALRAVIGVGG